MSEKRLISESRGNGQKVIFPLYRDISTVGLEMLTDFKRSPDTYALNKKERFVFNMSSTNRKEGLLGLSYGVFLMSNFMDQFDLKNYFSYEDGERLKNSFIALLNYVEENGFNVAPYSTEETNKRFFGFGKDKYAFIESLTWSLSCLLYAQRLNKNKLLDLEEIMPKVTEWVARSLALLVNNVIRSNGELGYTPTATDYMGWGPLTGCTETSLYFTHSVCETFGDVEDTVLGNSEVEGFAEKDSTYIAQINKAYRELPNNEKNKNITDIVQTFQDICLKVGGNVYKKYEKSLGKRFFYADGSEIASTEQISYSMQSPVLLNQLYVVMSAVYVNYHKEVERADKTVDKEEYKNFCSKLKNAVEMVYETYEDLRRRGKESVVNREYATFIEQHPKRDIGRQLANERINVAVLEALIIKAKAMIVTYVTQYPERELGDILAVVEDNRQRDAWLWSNLGYDLQQTERSISAILEFYIYYENYQKAFAEKDSKELETLKSQYDKSLADKEKELKDKIKYYEDKLSALERALTEANEKELAAEREKHTLEREVQKIVDAQVAASFQGTLVGLLKSIAADNASAKDKLSKEQKEVKDAIVELASSFFLPFNLETYNARANVKWSESSKNLLSVLRKDMGAFVIEWMGKLCDENNPAKDTPDAFVLKHLLEEKKN